MTSEKQKGPVMTTVGDTLSSNVLARLLNEASGVNSSFAAELAELCPALRRFEIVDARLLAEVTENGKSRYVNGEDVLAPLGGEGAVLRRIAEAFEDELHLARQDIQDMRKKLDRVTLSRDDTFRRFRELSSALSLFSDPQERLQEEKSATVDPGAIKMYFPGRELLTKQGVFVDGMIRVEPNERDYGVFGPYVTMLPGLYEISFLFDVGSPCSGAIEISVATNEGTQYATCSLRLESAVDREGKLAFFFSLREVTERCEFRILSSEASYTFRACLVRHISASEVPRIFTAPAVTYTVLGTGP